MRLFTATLSVLLLVCACDTEDKPASLPDAYEDPDAWLTATCELAIECDPGAWQVQDPQAWCETNTATSWASNPCADEWVSWKTCEAQERMDKGCDAVSVSGDPCADLQVSLEVCYDEKL